MLRQIIAFVIVTTSLWAWPKEHKLFDLNGDCQVVVSVLGDSFVYGVGDSDSLGYVLRAARIMPNVIFNKLGQPGLEARQLFRRLRRAFGKSESAYGAAILAADVVVLDLGRNDRWRFKAPEATARTLGRIRALIENQAEGVMGTQPLVVTAVMMLPNRGAQGPWVEQLNLALMAKHSPQHPTNLRFDKVSKRLLTVDNLHPSPEGYAALTKTFVNYLKGYAAKRLGRMFVDSDGDGVSDGGERKLWATDPLNADTNENLVSDGVELCRAGVS